jgi:hypothetical protein
MQRRARRLGSRSFENVAADFCICSAGKSPGRFSFRWTLQTISNGPIHATIVNEWIPIRRWGIAIDAYGDATAAIWNPRLFTRGELASEHGAQLPPPCVPKSRRGFGHCWSVCCLTLSVAVREDFGCAILEWKGYSELPKADKPSEPPNAGRAFWARSSEFRSESARAGFPVQLLRCGWTRPACRESS